jgi:signal transduction histidine kinase
MPPLLNWIVISLSLINTILLLWLGLTVSLNAERRSWGVWLISGGLLLGGIFFISHTAILGFGLTSLDDGINFWWHLGLLAALVLPSLWYIVVLWYAGFWEDRQSALFQRHKLAFPLNAAVTLISIVLLWIANPFPSFSQVITLQLSATPEVGGVPMMVIAYLASTLLNVGLSLDALRRPGPVRRIMGELARDRAKPWLIATSMMLLLVGFLIAGVMVWIALRGNQLVESGLYDNMTTGVAWFDLAISGLIALAVLLLGQAIVRYEVFTGKTLPQQRFMRHWRNVVLLSIVCGIIMSAALIRGIHPVYVLLMMAILVTVSYALFSQNSYAERERYIQHLRPFVTSQRLYDHLLTASDPTGVDINQPFQALCRDVLSAQVAYLAAVGPLAPLVGSVLVFPESLKMPTLPLTDVCRRFTSMSTMCIPLNPDDHGGACWAVPLWSERGLIGLLMLGEKLNGGLYTQEEIEIARASGERMIDTRASAELAQRLMTLQRQRLSESQVMDRRTRRVLHDDILPKLHTAMLALNADKSATAQAGVQALTTLHRDLANLLHTIPNSLTADIASIGVLSALRKLVENELSHEFDEVFWDIPETVAAVGRALPVLTAEVVYFAGREVIRNAARHGRGNQEDRPLMLKITAIAQESFCVSIEDNGVGFSALPSGINTGNGLALHSTMLAVVGGVLAITTVTGAGTRIDLSVNNPAETFSLVKNTNNGTPLMDWKTS